MASQRIAYIRQLWPDFDVNEGDMKQPTAEFVMTFLDKILEDIALLEFALGGEPSDKVLNQVSITDGSRKTVLCIIFRHIFAKIKGPQFGIEDIIDPDPKRFGKQVDILLNLVRYLEVNFANVFNSEMEDIDGQSKCRDDFIKDIDEFNERRNQIAFEKKELSLQLQSGEKEKYTSILRKVQGVTMEINPKYDKLTGIREKLAADTSAVEEAIQKENEEIEEIKENIILSPDAVSRDKVELMSKRKDLEERHAAIKNTADEKNIYACQLEHLCSTMGTVPEQIKDLAKKQLFSKNLEKGFHEDELNYKNAMDKYEAIMKLDEITKQKLSNIKEETLKLEEQYAAKLASLENDLLKANRDLQEAEEEHIKKGAEQVLVAQEIQIWKEKMTSLDEEEKILGENFLDRKQQIENEVDLFSWKIEEKVEHMERHLRLQPYGSV